MQLIKVNESIAARTRISVELVLSSDGITPATGLIPASTEIKVSKNGGNQSNFAGTLTEVAGGEYYYTPAAGELDTLGVLQVRCLLSTAQIFVGAAQIVAFDPYAATNLGLSALPTASPNASNGLATLGVGTGQFQCDGSGNIDTNVVNWKGSTAAAMTGDAYAAVVALPAVILATLYSGTHTIQSFFKRAAAALWGKSSGFTAGVGGPGKYRDEDDAKDRITATTDSDGNRTSVTTDGT